MLNMQFKSLGLLWFLTLTCPAIGELSDLDLSCNESRYEKFLRQHYVSKMNPKECDTLIKRRKIYDNNKNSCKATNTFIVKTTKKNLKNVCLNDGKAYNNNKNLYISNKSFALITCKLKGNPQKHPCSYRGFASYGKIVIGCENKLPVHFERVILLSKLNSTNVLNTCSPNE